LVVKDLIMAIKLSLERLNKNYCMAFQEDYAQISPDVFRTYLAEKKYLELPFAYEFYHQLRNLIDSGEVDLGGPLFETNLSSIFFSTDTDAVLPDFILHLPTTTRKIGVIEFRLASNPTRIETDLEMLAKFRRQLGYSYVIEVILGPKNVLSTLKEYLTNLSNPEGDKIMIVEFNTDSWKVVAGMIGYCK